MGAGIAGTGIVGTGNSSVDASSAHGDSLVGSSDSLDCSWECSLASWGTQPPALNTTFQPDESIDERLRSMVYTDRIDIENGLAEVLDDSGEILDLAINESDNMMQSILSVKRSSGAPGNSGVF